MNDGKHEGVQIIGGAALMEGQRERWWGDNFIPFWVYDGFFFTLRIHFFHIPLNLTCLIFFTEKMIHFFHFPVNLTYVIFSVKKRWGKSDLGPYPGMWEMHSYVVDI